MPFQHDGVSFRKPIRRVYAKQRWLDPWVLVGQERDGLKAVNSSIVTSPEVGKAEILFQSGPIFRGGIDSGVTYRAPVDFGDYYVQLTSEHPFENEVVHFRGIVRHDELASDRKDIASGDQPMVAYGLEDVLDKAKITKLKGVHDGEEYDLQVWPGFNARYEFGRGLRGNRTEDEASDGWYAFGGTSVWDFLQILQRILADNLPGGITWVITGQTDALALREEEFYVEPGESCLSVMNRMITRGRGLMWRLPDWPYYDPNKIEVEIEIRTIIPSPITIGTKTLPANSTQGPFSLVGGYPLTHIPDPVPIRRSTADRYERIIIQGEPCQVTATFSYADSTLVEKWDTALETEYTAGVLGGSNDEKDDARAGDKYHYVFQAHIVPTDWDFKSGDGIGNLATKSVLLRPEDDGTVTPLEDVPSGEQDDIPRWMQGWSFDSRTPFDASLDYSTSPITDNVASGEVQHVTLLALIKKTGATKYVHAETIGCDVSVMDNELGVLLEPEINHVIAGSLWIGTSNIDPVADYQSLILTASFNLPVRQRLVIETGAGHENDRALIINVPGAEYWWAADNTVTGIDSDGLLVRVHEDNQILRDDLYKLEAVAACAKPWFSQQRQPIRVVMKDIARLFEVAAYMTALDMAKGRDAINTPCTRRIINWQAFTTEIETGDIALDELIEIGQGLL